MNRTIFAIASLACFSLIARADYLIKERFENSGAVQQITLRIKDTKIRMDAGEQTSALIDSQTGVTTLLLHPNKAFLKISPEEVKERTKALKEMLGQKLENPADVQLRPTGKQEKINGFDTEEYTTNFNGIEMSISIAKQYPNYQKIVEALYRLQNGPALETFRSMSIPPEKYPGLPIRTTQTLMGQKLTLTLDSAQETDVPDADFAIPADYKELNPPAVGGPENAPTQKGQH
ncbi:MAG: DUF4412 domain-containing protein [Verrucomicrobia bacterium]|nr:DUF4412 domain-containing protein [Verrucomicrobiota bacterium]MBV9642015.1 DUF4412 domain-containing protein [Verrucomicrobiota bacterium]